MLSQELKNLQLDGDVDQSPATLTKYSTDASIFLVKPEVVVFVKGMVGLKF